MKFKEYLTEQNNDEAIETWLYQHLYDHGKGHRSMMSPLITVKDGKIEYTERGLKHYSNPHKMRLHFDTRSAARKTDKWEPPAYDPNVLFTNVAQLKIEGFHEVQNLKAIAAKSIEKLEIDGSEILSWDGIKGFTGLKILQLNDRTFENSAPLPIITLIRLPMIEHFEVLSILDDNETLLKLVRIVKKYLPSKNVADCMDELMEAGLKEYAK
jgi:hypothetical protein